MKNCIFLILVLLITSCATKPKYVVEKEVYNKQDREDKIVQEYIASVMPEVTDNFVLPLSLSVSELTEDQITEELVSVYLEKLKGSPNIEGVAELNIAGIELAGLLKDIVAFAIENVVGQKTPQPWNVFYWTAIGKKAWRQDKEIIEE